MKLLNTTIGKKRKMNGNESVTYCRQIKPFFLFKHLEIRIEQKISKYFLIKLRN